MVLSIQHPPRLGNGEIPARANQLLGLLPESELQQLLFSSQRLVLPAKQTLYQPNKAIEQVYFPLRGIISLVNISEAGLIAESAMVSNEGMIATATFLGANFMVNWAIAQTDCLVISLPVKVLRQEFAYGGELQRILLRYSQIFLAQVSQNVFCSCHHTLEQRLARWLLSYSDRLNASELSLTQETLAELIGVRRSSLSVVAADLRQRNLIDYCRGKIMILNPIALRRVSCECDRLIWNIYSRLLNL